MSFLGELTSALPQFHKPNGLSQTHQDNPLVTLRIKHRQSPSKLLSSRAYS